MKKYLRQNKKNAEIAEDTKKILHGEPVDRGKGRKKFVGWPLLMGRRAHA